MNSNYSYKIRDTVTGLYYAGSLKWSKCGKTWSTLGTLKNAVRYYNRYNKSAILDNAAHAITLANPRYELVIMRMQEHGSVPVSFIELYKADEIVDAIDEYNYTRV